eukprot:scaffold15499_cov29-Tisochrysis_lutea.AAC.1
MRNLARCRNCLYAMDRSRPGSACSRTELISWPTCVVRPRSCTSCGSSSLPRASGNKTRGCQ